MELNEQSFGENNRKRLPRVQFPSITGTSGSAPHSRSSTETQSAQNARPTFGGFYRARRSARFWGWPPLPCWNLEWREVPACWQWKRPPNQRKRKSGFESESMDLIQARGFQS